MPDSEEENIAETEVLEALGRVIDGAGFDPDKNSARLLSYVVTEAIEGRGDRIKALTIAQDVFGRGAEFDASKDSIVRVEMKRLRESLDHYYDTAGSTDPVRIAIPKGTYLPEFTHTGTARAAPPATVKRRFPMVAAIAMLALVVSTAVAWSFLRAPADPGEGEPHVAVAYDGTPTFISYGMALETMSRFHNIHLADEENLERARTVADYLLLLTGYPGRLDARLVHRESETVISSAVFWHDAIRNPDIARSIAPFQIWLGQNMARNGLLEADYIRRGSAKGDFACSVLTETYFGNQTDENHLAARDCVMARLNSGHNSARLQTDLALLTREEHSDQRNLLPGNALDRAARAAREAISLDRFDSQAHYGLMTVLFAVGAEQEGIASGERALELNPYDGEAIGGFAARINYVGKHERALELFDRSREFVPGGVTWRDYGYFLAYLGTGDMDNAAAAGLSLQGLTKNSLYAAALAISHAHMGNMAKARDFKERLMEREPDFRDMFERRSYAPALVDELVARLEAI